MSSVAGATNATRADLESTATTPDRLLARKTKLLGALKLIAVFWRHLQVQAYPKGAHSRHHLVESLEGAWFDYVGVGAQFVGAADVVGIL